MAERIVTQKNSPIISGNARIQIKTRQHHHWTIVGPFATLNDASAFGAELIENPGPVIGLLVEHRNGLKWKPVWRFVEPRRLGAK